MSLSRFNDSWKAGVRCVFSAAQRREPVGLLLKSFCIAVIPVTGSRQQQQAAAQGKTADGCAFCGSNYYWDLFAG